MEISGFNVHVSVYVCQHIYTLHMWRKQNPYIVKQVHQIFQFKHYSRLGNKIGEQVTPTVCRNEVGLITCQLVLLVCGNPCLTIHPHQEYGINLQQRYPIIKLGQFFCGAFQIRTRDVIHS